MSNILRHLSKDAWVQSYVPLAKEVGHEASILLSYIIANNGDGPIDFQQVWNDIGIEQSAVINALEVLEEHGSIPGFDVNDQKFITRQKFSSKDKQKPKQKIQLKRRKKSKESGSKDLRLKCRKSRNNQRARKNLHSLSLQKAHSDRPCLLRKQVSKARTSSVQRLSGAGAHERTHTRAKEKPTIDKKAILDKPEDYGVDPNSLINRKKFPKVIKRYIDFWNEQEDLPTLRYELDEYGNLVNPSKRVLNTIEIIRRYRTGKLFPDKELDFTDFKIAVRRFVLCATDPFVKPSNPKIKEQLRKTALPDFFYNSRAKNPSKMLSYGLTEPKIDNSVECKDEELLEFFKQKFAELVGLKEVAFSSGQVNDAIRAVNTTIEFHQGNKYLTNLPRRKVMALVFSCIKQQREKWMKGNLGVSIFTHPKLYNEWLPSFLKEQGYIKKDQFRSAKSVL